MFVNYKMPFGGRSKPTSHKQPQSQIQQDVSKQNKKPDPTQPPSIIPSKHVKPCPIPTIPSRQSNKADPIASSSTTALISKHITTVSLSPPPPPRCRDGRFRIGDEIVNVNGKSLRGLSMEDATFMLRSSCASLSSGGDTDTQFNSFFSLLVLFFDSRGRVEIHLLNDCQSVL